MENTKHKSQLLVNDVSPVLHSRIMVYDDKDSDCRQRI